MVSRLSSSDPAAALAAWSHEALDRLARQEAAAVLAEAEQWCATLPTAGTAHRLRALALFHHGRIEAAEAACAPVLADPATETHGLATLAIIRGARGQMGDACQLLEAAITLAPEIGEFHFNLARILSAIDQSTSAIQVLEQVFTLYPELRYWENRPSPAAAPPAPPLTAPTTRLTRMAVMTRNLHLNLLRRNGQPGHALRLQEALGEPDSPAGWLHKGHILADLGRYGDAQACYAAVPATAPESVEAQWSQRVLGLHGAPLEVQGKPPAIVRIFICCHQPGPVLEMPPFVPIQAGRAISPHRLPYAGDDTGDHISGRNEAYSELTAHYWLWHNALDNPDFTHIGLCHYRRYPWFAIGPGVMVSHLAQLQAMTLPSLVHALAARYDLLLPTPLNLPLPPRQHWRAIGLPPATLDTALSLLEKRYPAMVPTLHRVMDQDRFLYTGNILITSKAEFAACMAWLFGLLFAIEARERLQPGGIWPRIYGHLAERLLTIYVRHRHEQDGVSLAHFPLVLVL